MYSLYHNFISVIMTVSLTGIEHYLDLTMVWFEFIKHVDRQVKHSLHYLLSLLNISESNKV